MGNDRSCALGIACVNGNIATTQHIARWRGVDCAGNDNMGAPMERYGGTRGETIRTPCLYGTCTHYAYMRM